MDYVRQVYTIDPGGYPFLSYIGLNFTKNTLKNYKFYFSFFKRLNEEEIGKLLPVSDRGHFDELYAQWSPTKLYNMHHRGVTFALKVNPDGTLTHYYHLRLPSMPFGLPKRLSMSQEDLDRNYHGACEEFTKDKIHLKRYYYIHDPHSIAETLEMVNLYDDVQEHDWLDTVEYIESENRDKVAFFTTSPTMLQTLIEERGPPRLMNGLIKMCHDCGFELFGPGSALDGKDHSVYFVQNSGPSTAPGYYIFDGVSTFVRKHLKVEDF